jgi:hypothetical protein
VHFCCAIRSRGQSCALKLRARQDASYSGGRLGIAAAAGVSGHILKEREGSVGQVAGHHEKSAERNELAVGQAVKRSAVRNEEPLGTHRTIRRAHDRATERKEGTVGHVSTDLPSATCARRSSCRDKRAIRQAV